MHVHFLHQALTPLAAPTAQARETTNIITIVFFIIIKNHLTCNSKTTRIDSILESMEGSAVMNIDYFKEFVTLASTQSYWEASSRLFMGQSTLSKHITQMERDLGVPLFDRTTRKVELTEFGSLMLPYARALVDIQNEYTDQLANAKAVAQGKFVLGSIPYSAEYRITDLLIGFNAQYPGQPIKILEEDSITLKNALRHNQCELAFLREPSDWPVSDADLVKIPYAMDTLVALLPKDHQLASRNAIRLEELQDESFLILKKQSVSTQICTYACQRAGFTPQVVYNGNRLYNIFSLVSQGMGVSLLMKRHVHPPDSIDPPHMAFSLVDIEPTVRSSIVLSYRKSGRLSDIAQRFIDYVMEQQPHLFPEAEAMS